MQQYVEVLYDPETFFERGEEASNLMIPVGVLVLVGVVSAAGSWLSAQRTAELFARMGGGGAGFATITSSVSIGIALVLPFVAWVLYAGLFHAISGVMGGDGDVKRTLTFTAWGFLPKVLGSFAGVVSTYVLLQSVQLPAEVTPQSMDAYQQAVQSHPATMVALAVGILVLAWSAYIWVAAVQHARDVERADAAIAVGIPVAIVLVIRLGTELLL